MPPSAGLGSLIPTGRIPLFVFISASILLPFIAGNREPSNLAFDMDHTNHGDGSGMGSDGGGMNHKVDMHMSMHMSFFWGKEATILFDWWVTHTWAQFLFSWLAIFVFCVFHEWLLTQRIMLSTPPKTTPMGDNLLPSNSEASVSSPRRPLTLSPARKRMMVTALYVANITSSYLIMLVVMTFNAPLFLSVVLGLSTGFAVFGYGRAHPLAQTAELCCPS
eukprot:TRINITY_DN630_c0_g1_i3.p1 TRINITY_DN630_c0_g1~~TRINITY_DN630_c0_g1_i3.p1  ORF type:complete len:220 (-),score=26.75 TRINITY_DN630_c0_g1_i3:690-1349(-)